MRGGHPLAPWLPLRCGAVLLTKTGATRVVGPILLQALVEARWRRIDWNRVRWSSL
jgi:hypothetical protein